MNRVCAIFSCQPFGASLFPSFFMLKHLYALPAVFLNKRIHMLSVRTVNYKNSLSLLVCNNSTFRPCELVHYRHTHSCVLKTCVCALKANLIMLALFRWCLLMQQSTAVKASQGGVLEALDATLRHCKHGITSPHVYDPIIRSVCIHACLYVWRIIIKNNLVGSELLVRVFLWMR